MLRHIGRLTVASLLVVVPLRGSTGPLRGEAAKAVAERIAINDNRRSAGTLENGVLTIRLEARDGDWHPDRDADPGITLHAFGEEGKATSIPGPRQR